MVKGEACVFTNGAINSVRKCWILNNQVLENGFLPGYKCRLSKWSREGRPLEKLTALLSATVLLYVSWCSFKCTATLILICLTVTVQFFYCRPGGSVTQRKFDFSWLLWSSCSTAGGVSQTGVEMEEMPHWNWHSFLHTSGMGHKQ